MQLPKLKRWEAVRVEWIDSAGGDSGWVPHDRARKDSQIEGCITVGMVNGQRADRLQLCLSHDGQTGKHRHVDGYITIPAVAIVSLQRFDTAGPPAESEKSK